MDTENLVPTVQPERVSIPTIVDTYLITCPNQIRVIQLKRKKRFFFRSLVTENVSRVLSNKEVNKFTTRLDIN